MSDLKEQPKVRLFLLLSVAIVIFVSGCVDVNVKEMPLQQVQLPTNEVFVKISDVSAIYEVVCSVNGTRKGIDLNVFRTSDGAAFFSYVADGQVLQKVTIVHPIVREDFRASDELFALTAPPNSCRFDGLSIKYHLNVTVDDKLIIDMDSKVNEDVDIENFESVIATYYNSDEGWKRLYQQSLQYSYRI